MRIKITESTDQKNARLAALSRSVMTKAQLKKAYAVGSLEEVAKELQRYGTIQGDKSYSVESGFHAGEHRKLEISYYGLIWNIEKHNGQVARLGWKIV
jgi:hypothetical protein